MYTEELLALINETAFEWAGRACLGGEMYALSWDIVRDLASCVLCKTQAETNAIGNEDVAVSTWVALVRNPGFRNISRNLKQPAEHNGKWAHSGELKKAEVYYNCMYDPKGCQGENGNIVAYPPKVPSIAPTSQ